MRCTVSVRRDRWRQRLPLVAIAGRDLFAAPVTCWCWCLGQILRSVTNGQLSTLAIRRARGRNDFELRSGEVARQKLAANSVAVRSSRLIFVLLPLDASGAPPAFSITAQGSGCLFPLANTAG